MDKQHEEWMKEPHPGDLLAGMRPALMLLAKAHEFARDLQTDVWQFAVDLESLEAKGLSHNDLRWLVAKGYLECAVETHARKEGVRAFRPWDKLHFCDQACFVLTADGLTLERGEAGHYSVTVSQPAIVPAGEAGKLLLSGEIPEWRLDQRELWLGLYLVKRFPVPAENQELLLRAFQEQHWIKCMDDPLPPTDGIDAKRRLNQAIRRLNEKQTNPLIRFHGNGNGTGVRWDYA